MMNFYQIKYDVGYFGEIKEYSRLFPLELVEVLTLQEYSLIVDSLNSIIKLPPYLSILNSLVLFIIIPLNIFLFIFHRNSLVQIVLLIVMLVLFLCLVVFNAYEYLMPKKKIKNFMCELNIEFNKKNISFEIDSRYIVMVFFNYQDHYNIPQPFSKMQMIDLPSIVQNGDYYIKIDFEENINCSDKIRGEGDTT
ncbi:hypothetical protein DICPUDRAFT_82519 [Dictyostelium purpureum]|uniref:Uncharacterized protein n=1 Tax=Dictyostelium purpureum TaxID=5786 RepID=F0ZWR9_DICPU|nr:uncharacterized protein DICPUDRAFT_82519 [Dictyostelium purpureum]EGC31611.1 hypothetical protein DICPUDRAFT_82519 [Dictyostelium purpureum]|eukprot:XP_003291869.1 hypothetical protein DICPUDRAFT_82519 [Dictyostelium purpureum]